MIYGIGVDMVEIARIKNSLERQGRRFIERIAHPVEIKSAPRSSDRQAEYWAARFAAKEAFAKALGTGIGKTVSLKSVGVSKRKSGQPALELSKKLARTLCQLSIEASHISLTHTDDAAVAVVVLERSENRGER